ncbi:hypothetical protein [Neobacillus sp. D3-1R]|uniref:hypothetical protein n=1 Tax=Neobacillus sp. D3-1R TaxID=3445778 RepID=UPI003FA035C7
MRNVLLLMITVISAYLFINWLPIPDPLNLSNLILEFVFNPVKVFAAAISFFVGFISTGILLRDLIVYMKKTNAKNRYYLLNIINMILFIMVIFLLFKNGFLHMVLFFSFAFLYGMMTMSNNK